MVTSPDQHQPGHAKAARILGLGAAVVLLLFLFGNHRSRIENVWLVGLAATLVLIFAADWLLRRNGLRR
ncbi:MAG: DUF2631 domain-containing protein [Pseudonocardiales bacterium]